MKYIRLFLFMFLGLFIFNLDVKAEGCSATCYYEMDGVNGGWVASFDIAYDGNSISFNSNPNDNYFDGYSRVLSVQEGITIDYIQQTDANGSKELFCPNLYWAYDTSGLFGSNIYYYVYFDQRKITGKHEKTGTIVPTDNSKVNNDNCNFETATTETLSCSYIHKEDSWRKFELVLKKNGDKIEVGDYTYEHIGEGTGENNFEFKGFNEFKCPSYIDIEEDAKFSGKYFTITSSTSKTNWIYKGNIQSGEENKSFMTYVEYTGSNKVHVFKDNDSQLGISFVKNEENITISNLNEENKNGIKYSEIISSDNVENYPRYIIEYVDENKNYTYKFADYSDSNANVNYINLKHIGDLLSTGGNVDETCRSLLGSSFLDFLNNNVLKIIYIGIPILLIVLTTFDFAKLVIIDDKDGVSAAGKKFGKRVIAAFLIYLVPTILIFVSNIFANDEISKCAKTLKDLTETIDN